MFVDHGSKFIAVDTLALMEEKGVKLDFISSGEHQQNLVERAHLMLWSTLRAIRVTASIDT